jgi:alpha-ketoglutarate-dependent taurine dioxygenase
VVEAFCAKNDIEFEWRAGDELRTRQVCQGVAKHPVSGEPVWFNQAHLFHNSNMPAQYRTAMLSLFKEEDLPRNAMFGDGTPIDDATLDTVRGVLRETRVVFPWQRGDILMLDNMLVAHAREPFTGPRRVVVAMAEHFALKR